MIYSGKFIAANKTVTYTEISANDSIGHKFINTSEVTAPLGNNPVKCKCAHVLHVVGSIYVAAQRENSHHLHPLLGVCTVKEMAERNLVAWTMSMKEALHATETCERCSELPSMCLQNDCRFLALWMLFVVNSFKLHLNACKLILFEQSNKITGQEHV